MMASGNWIPLYTVSQILYFVSLIAFFYFLTLPIDWVETPTEPEELEGVERLAVPEDSLPLIIMAYPVLREDVATMNTTLMALGWSEYPSACFRVIAIPNSHDIDTIAALRLMQPQFPFLEIMEVPPTNDPGWNVVWRAWQSNPKAYWFHQGRTRGRRDLLPKKTRQLIFLFYTLCARIGTDWVLDYIDADSIPPPRHFAEAAAGLREYDVLQATNVAGNLLDSMPASLHAFDHMCWDGLLYPHMSARGRHPFYVLGKGLFYKAADLMELGGFNPWITIEDPEVGMRFWTNGRRLGVIFDPLIEEVPRTLMRGIIQRNRWVCGFFQSLGRPLRAMGMPFWRRQQARLNIVPVLSLPVNIVGLPTGVRAASTLWTGANPFPFWIVALSVLNVGLYCVTMAIIYTNAWRRTQLVLRPISSRIWYMVRVNPLSLFIYHMIWTIPIVIGFMMFICNLGKAWIRTQKFDADRRFVEDGPEAFNGNGDRNRHRNGNGKGNGNGHRNGNGHPNGNGKRDNMPPGP
jgi:glycosyltransferase XagB